MTVSLGARKSKRLGPNLVSKSGQHRIIVGSDNARATKMVTLSRPGGGFTSTQGASLMGHCASLRIHKALITVIRNALSQAHSGVSLLNGS